MKNQTTFFLGLAFLLGSTSCIKEHVKPVLTVTVSTFAGSGYGGSLDGIGASASFDKPAGIAGDFAGNLYVSDFWTGLIRKISPTAVVTTLASNGDHVNEEGKGTNFWNPSGMAVDALGNVYVADSHNSRIRKITQQGLITTFAGGDGQGAVDGPGAAAKFNHPGGVALDAAGSLYVADGGNNLIRKISPDGVVTTFAGSGTAGAADGKGTAASFNNPADVALDAFGNVYVTDGNNNKIRKITPKGVVSMLAGSGAKGDSDGKGTAASFNSPNGMDLDASGNIYVADRRNNKIRKVTPQGVVTTLAGSGEFGRENGPGASASFNFPSDVVVDSFGDIYVADYGNLMIRKIVIR
jgi:serine/threonine-protein kinase